MFRSAQGAKEPRLSNRFSFDLCPARSFIEARRSSVVVGFRAPVELHGNSLYRPVRRVLESFPFVCFRKPIFHFLLGERSPLAAHYFQRCKPALGIHLLSLICSLGRPTYDLVTRLDAWVIWFGDLVLGDLFAPGVFHAATQ